MTRKQEIMMAVVANAAADCREASFIDPSDVKSVKQLAKMGILKVRKSSEKLAGFSEYYATYA